MVGWSGPKSLLSVSHSRHNPFLVSKASILLPELHALRVADSSMVFNLHFACVQRHLPLAGLLITPFLV